MKKLNKFFFMRKVSIYQYILKQFPILVNIYYILSFARTFSDRSMGCNQSEADVSGLTMKPSIKSIELENDPFVSGKLIGTATTISSNTNITSLKVIGEKRQDLSVSDYEGFLIQSKKEERTEYSANFKFINIHSIKDEELVKIRKIDVDPLRCTRAQLSGVAADIILDNSFSRSKFDPQHILNLTMEIAHNYNSVSYHNFSHGFALMQMLYRCFKIDPKLGEFYSNEELTFYLIAGLGHDLNHNGTNNAYETKMNTELAIISNNDAVLERMHLKTLMDITRSNPELDVFALSSNPTLYKENVARAILATDMAKHFKHLEKLTETRKSNQLDFSKDQSKKIYMDCLFHGCDISTSLLPNNEYMNWICLLTYQFHEQTKLEAKNNIAVTQFLKFKSVTGFCDGEVGFLNTFVVPLWKQISTSFPNLNKLFANTEKNINSIKALKEKETK